MTEKLSSPDSAPALPHDHRHYRLPPYHHSIPLVWPPGILTWWSWQIYCDIVPVYKLVFLTSPLWALRNFRRLKLNYIAPNWARLMHMYLQLRFKQGQRQYNSYFKLGMGKTGFCGNRFSVVENRFSVLLTFIKNILLYKANNFNFMYKTL